MVSPFNSTLSSSMPPRVTIDFYYDIGSSYSYYAFEVLLRYVNYWNIDLQLHPTLLGAVFKITGNTSPALSTFKRPHMMRDVFRVGEEFQIPFSIGPEFPGNTLQVMRMLRYLKDQLPSDKFTEATRHYFRENFVVNTPLSSPTFVASLPTSILSKSEMEDALQKFKDKSITDKMKADSAAVVEKYGAFGFPWMVVHRSDGEETSFWGSDRLSNMAHWLGPEYPWFGPVPPKSSL